LLLLPNTKKYIILFNNHIKFYNIIISTNCKFNHLLPGPLKKVFITASSKRSQQHFIQLIIIIFFIGRKEEQKNDQNILGYANSKKKTKIINSKNSGCVGTHPQLYMGPPWSEHVTQLPR